MSRRWIPAWYGWLLLCSLLAGCSLIPTRADADAPATPAARLAAAQDLQAMAERLVPGQTRIEQARAWLPKARIMSFDDGQQIWHLFVPDQARSLSSQLSPHDFVSYEQIRGLELQLKFDADGLLKKKLLRTQPGPGQAAAPGR
ncbi:hypothetical protein [Pelomonas sp. SE-A7]|uniref:hypothetical protein n=1 Tax=Pelomonas sp. SE-A7 TaxID=3054953 RepID=UPI00259D1EDD|nr:hypothetical protein [Pelomonas sp. SE-A7]MDM4765909.1 hypothetical protein [Pelomonas sp. SE-A7]